jgi:hypothetical protein
VRVQIDIDRHAVLTSAAVDAKEVDAALGCVGFSTTACWGCHGQSQYWSRATSVFISPPKKIGSPQTLDQLLHFTAAPRSTRVCPETQHTF